MGTSSQVRVGIAALSLVAGAAAAQDGEFNRPLSRTAERWAQPGTSGETRIITQEGDETVEIVISGDQVTAKVNGKKVPAERIRRSKGKVEILDKNGDVLKSLNVGGDAMVWREPGQVVVGGPDMPRPKVMIGITMGEDEDGIIVEHVYDGLPASKAGLKAKDVIVEVDGEKNPDQKAFREALNRKDAGEKVVVKVKRDGEVKELGIVLQKFDSEKLGGGQPQVWGQLKGIEGMEGMHEALRMNPEAWEQFNRAMKNMPEGQRAFVWGQGPEEGFKFTPFGGQNSQRLVEKQAELDRKIAELDEKLSKISEQMARLEKLMSKLGEKEGSR